MFSRVYISSWPAWTVLSWIFLHFLFVIHPGVLRPWSKKNKTKRSSQREQVKLDKKTWPSSQWAAANILKTENVLWVHLHRKPSHKGARTSCLSSPETLQKPLSHINQSKKRHQSCLYNETERAARCRITGCTRESIPPSPENRGRERKRMEEENPPPPTPHPRQCRTITTVTTAKHTLKERESERERRSQNEGARGDRKVVYFKSAWCSNRQWY